MPPLARPDGTPHSTHIQAGRARLVHSGHVFWAAVVALISASCFALASVGQHHVASLTPPEGGFNLKLMLRLMRSPMWWAGAFGDFFGFILQGVALALGAVSVVQPLLVTGLLLAIPISAAVEKRKVKRAEWTGALICCVGLAAFLIAAQPTSGDNRVSGHDGILLLVTVVPIVTVLLLASLRLVGVARAVVLALCAGGLFGVCSPLFSAAVNNLGDFFSWPILVVAIAGVAGFVLTQTAYQAGSLPAPLATLTIVEPVVSVTLGVALLHESLDTTPVSLVVIVLSVIAVVVGVALVARNAPDAQRVMKPEQLSTAV